MCLIYFLELNMLVILIEYLYVPGSLSNKSNQIVTSWFKVFSLGFAVIRQNKNSKF